ncbi:MAG: hypothetical protein HKO10_05545, partial [Acidimicrobiia bacterium]|nr:hypothetical protein [Acidimicrobiia bacterium]
MFTGGLGTIMVMAGLFIAAQVSQPVAPEVEVLANNIADSSTSTSTSEVVE